MDATHRPPGWQRSPPQQAASRAPQLMQMFWALAPDVRAQPRPVSQV